MCGELGILNVGAGDTKISFDRKNPAELLRAKRIVTDMLKRGYALLIEVDGKDGKKETKRVKRFDPETCEYIIADFDSEVAAEHDKAEQAREEGGKEAIAGAEAPAAKTTARPRGRPRLTERRVPAEKTRGVAVARSSGG